MLDLNTKFNSLQDLLINSYDWLSYSDIRSYQHGSLEDTARVIIIKMWLITEG